MTGPGAGNGAPAHVEPQFSPVTVEWRSSLLGTKKVITLVFHTVLGPLHLVYDENGLDQLTALLREARASLRGGLIVPDVEGRDL